MCEVVVKSLLSVSVSHLSYVVITILATDGFDGTDIEPSEDLRAGINPQLVPVTEGNGLGLRRIINSI